MKKSNLRIVSLLLTVLTALYLAFPAAAVDTEKERILRNSNQTSDFTNYNPDGVLIGGGDEPMELWVYPNGTFGVFIDEYNPWPEQYYGDFGYGSIWHIGNQKYST